MEYGEANSGERLNALTPREDNPATALTRILRLPEVIARVGLRRPTIYLHISKGTFPKQINLGPRAVGWLESEIDAWIAARIRARQGSKA